MPANLSIVERIRGKRTRDIALPNDTDEVDDRILERQERSSLNPLKRLGVRVQRMKQRSTKRARR